jgi:hypothetical protein
MKPSTRSPFLIFISGALMATAIIFATQFGMEKAKTPTDPDASSSSSVNPRESRQQPARGDGIRLVPTPNASSSQIPLSEKIVNLPWVDRQSAFRDELRNGLETPQEVWRLFLEIEDASPEKIGPSGVAREIFGELAKIDPIFAIKCLQELEAGIVRESALLGLGTEIPAHAVQALYDALKEDGFNDEIGRLMNHLQSAARTYSTTELRALLDSEIPSEDLRTVLESFLAQKDAASTDSTPSKTALRAFEKDLSTDPFSAAERLQRNETIASDDLASIVPDVGRQLSHTDPKRALEWASQWDGPLRDGAVRAVVQSWIQLDPKGCSSHVSKQKNKAVISACSIEIVRYLINKESFHEASTWTEMIEDTEVRTRLTSEISNLQSQSASH